MFLKFQGSGLFESFQGTGFNKSFLKFQGSGLFESFQGTGFNKSFDDKEFFFKVSRFRVV